MRLSPRPDAPAPRDRLRVLYLTWRDGGNPESGGAEVFSDRTAEVIAGLGHQVTLLTAHYAGAAHEERAGVVHVLRRGNRFTVYLQGLWHLLRHKRSYDVVIDVQNGVPFWTPLVSRVPVVNITHHLHRDQWRTVFGPILGSLGWALEARAAPRVYRHQQYVAVSRSTMHDLVDVGVEESRIQLIYSGIDPAPPVTERLPDSGPSLICIGRLVPHKHFELAIDLVADLQQRHPGLRLDLVGSGYWHDELMAHARERGVEQSVTFHGFVDDRTKHELLDNADVLLVPSGKEGWGLTIIEAAQHGVPSVAFAYAGGPTESIVHEVTGLLAADYDDMADEVDRLVGDPTLREKYGENARAHAAQFSWQRTGEELADLLGRVAAQRVDD